MYRRRLDGTEPVVREFSSLTGPSKLLVIEEPALPAREGGLFCYSKTAKLKQFDANWGDYYRAALSGIGTLAPGSSFGAFARP